MCADAACLLHSRLANLLATHIFAFISTLHLSEKGIKAITAGDQWPFFIFYFSASAAQLIISASVGTHSLGEPLLSRAAI